MRSDLLMSALRVGTGASGRLDCTGAVAGGQAQARAPRSSARREPTLHWEPVGGERDSIDVFERRLSRRKLLDARLGRRGPSPATSCVSHCVLGGGFGRGRSPPPSCYRASRREERAMSEADPIRGHAVVMQPADGPSYWQPVPASGHADPKLYPENTRFDGL